MAKKSVTAKNSNETQKYKITSIGCSRNTRPKNKHSKRHHKRYRGQGK
ncbi:hypothetical protein [Desulfohalovibrio reitneri]|jgi:hypothetical protein|nr:hypothetical protein [Desulfohalovibrio reitneri]